MGKFETANEDFSREDFYHKLGRKTGIPAAGSTSENRDSFLMLGRKTGIPAAGSTTENRDSFLMEEGFYQVTATCERGDCEVVPLGVCKRVGDIALEVFRVEINCQGYLRGKIRTTNGLSRDVLYNQRRVGECIDEGDDLLLIGPTRSIILSYDSTLIYVDLVHKMVNSSEEERRFGEPDGMNWSVDYMSGRPMNTPLFEVFNSDDNKVSATMYYAFFSHAFQATVEFKLLDTALREPVGVYGSIAAMNDLFIDYPKYKSTLFRKKQDQSLLVQPGKKIRLFKAIVAAPIYYNLIVFAVLKSQEVNIPSAKLTFPSKPNGTSVINIDEIIQVKVTWKVSWPV